jgi:hypothetical protein
MSEPEQATVAALTDTIAFELRAQLALSGLGADEIEVVAAMIADQVLTESNVTRRHDSPVFRRRPA